MAGVPTLPNYGCTSYWEERYAASSDVHEWYLSPDTLWIKLRPLVEELVVASRLHSLKNVIVYVPGCGTSALGSYVASQGVGSVRCSDVSPVAISA